MTLAEIRTVAGSPRSLIRLAGPAVEAEALTVIGKIQGARIVLADCPLRFVLPPQGALHAAGQHQPLQPGLGRYFPDHRGWRVQVARYSLRPFRDGMVRIDNVE